MYVILCDEGGKVENEIKSEALKNQISVLSDEKQEKYVIINERGEKHKGTVVIKAIRCGKGCRGCPHKFYKYVCWRDQGKLRWKYIGKVKELKSK